MDALDGNAIAGPLFEYFGKEMTIASGSCASCGAVSQIGQLRVFTRCPGTVVRCPSCGNVVIVLASIRDALRVELTAFRLIEAPG